MVSGVVSRMKTSKSAAKDLPLYPLHQNHCCFTYCYCLPHKDADDDFNVWWLGAVLLCYCVVINSFCLPCVSFYPCCLQSNVWPSIMANTESHDRAPCTLCCALLLLFVTLAPAKPIFSLPHRIKVSIPRTMCRANQEMFSFTF